MCNYIICCVYIKVVNTVPVLAGMYCTRMYTDIETSTFHTGLNIGRTSHVLAILANSGQYRPVSGNAEKSFFFYFFILSFVIFEFLLGQNGNLLVLFIFLVCNGNF